MNGAESLVHTLLDGGVDVCFANPGTSEMHFVAALDKVEGMRCVLGLFEGVVTGAADGYYRIKDRPAATLLHLGPGLANGLANLHNAKKANSGIVNIVGDHATGHLQLNAPLTSDIDMLARPMSNWVHSSPSAATIQADGQEAIRQANSRPGRIATLILPADTAWTETTLPVSQPYAVGQNAIRWAGALVQASPEAVLSDESIRQAAQALRLGPTTLLLLGGRALRASATEWAGRIAAATGCAVMSECLVARLERGAGRVMVPRLPYAVDPAMAVLAPFDKIVLVGAKQPVAFFAYPGKPGVLSRPGCEYITLASHADDLKAALHALSDALGASTGPVALVAARNGAQAMESFHGPITPDNVARLMVALMPTNAIVVDEAVTTGRSFDKVAQGAAPHDWLTVMGGSIGFALPAAVGAAIAAPDRKVIALEGDGSGMYTLQALWTMVRENLDITVVIFANRAYKILLGEFSGVGAGVPGQRAIDMLSLDRPDLDWVSLAKGMGMQACRVSDMSGFSVGLQKALAVQGPALVEVVL